MQPTGESAFIFSIGLFESVYLYTSCHPLLVYLRHMCISSFDERGETVCILFHHGFQNVFYVLTPPPTGVVLVRCACDKLHLIADNLGWFDDKRTNIEVCVTYLLKYSYRQALGPPVVCNNPTRPLPPPLPPCTSLHPSHAYVRTRRRQKTHNAFEMTFS